MSLLDYPGAKDWYTQQYMRQNGPGDLYEILLEEKTIPVTFYSDWNFDIQSKNKEYADIIHYLNRHAKLGKSFFFNEVRNFEEPSWNYHGLQILVHPRLANRRASGRYFGMGIIGIDPFFIQNGRYEVVFHELGHGIFGYGHHGVSKNCIMDFENTVGKKHAWICDVDLQVIENLKNGKKLDRRIA